MSLQAEVKALQAKERDFGKSSLCWLLQTTKGIDSGRSFCFAQLDNLKKQANQQATEYDRLATDYNKLTGSNSNKRAD